jgi:transposase
MRTGGIAAASIGIGMFSQRDHKGKQGQRPRIGNVCLLMATKKRLRKQPFKRRLNPKTRSQFLHRFKLSWLKTTKLDPTQNAFAIFLPP